MVKTVEGNLCYIEKLLIIKLMEVSMNTTPDVAFLGICDKYSANNILDSNLWSHNFIGLKKASIHYIYPMTLKGIYFVFAVYNPAEFKGSEIIVRDHNNRQILSAEFKVLAPMNEMEKDELPFSEKKETIQVPSLNPSWEIFVYQIDDSIDTMIYGPTNCTIVLKRERLESVIGELVFGYAFSEPLSSEKIQALKSDPLSSKKIVYELNCNKCNKRMNTYAAIERNREIENENMIWFENLPSHFICDCGNRIDLEYLRRNLHLLLEHRNRQNELTSTRMYEKRTLDVILRGYEELIYSDCVEEEIQKYIESNTIILQQFSPVKIFFKRPILSKHKTDFVILTSKKELLFIEIERPNIKLVVKSGAPSGHVNHAFDQVTDWLHTYEDHKIAVLDDLGIGRSEVTKTRGIVIAGNEKAYDPKDVDKLKWRSKEIEFYTYNDIFRSLVNLIRSIDDI